MVLQNFLKNLGKISATRGKSPREIVDYCLISFWLVLNNILFGFSFKLCKYMFIMDTINRIKNNEPMPWIFLSGGAGVGKTMTINYKESLDFIVMSMWTFALHELCMSQLCETIFIKTTHNFENIWIWTNSNCLDLCLFTFWYE